MHLLRGRHIVSCRLDGIDGVCGLRRGSVLNDGRFVHVLQRRNILGCIWDIKLFELCTRRELGCWVKRLLRLFVWNLPGRDWRIKLFELRRGNPVCARSERLFELCRWDIPSIHGCLKLCRVRCWNSVKRGCRVGVEHLRAVRCGQLVFCSFHNMHKLLRGHIFSFWIDRIDGVCGLRRGSVHFVGRCVRRVRVRLLLWVGCTKLHGVCFW
jgi:hypothetical protein